MFAVRNEELRIWEIKVPAELLFSMNISTEVMRVYAYIVSKMDYKTADCVVTAEQYAEAAGISAITAKRHIKDMLDFTIEGKPLLLKDKMATKAGKGWNVNVWTLPEVAFNYKKDEIEEMINTFHNAHEQAYGGIYGKYMLEPQDRKTLVEVLVACDNDLQLAKEVITEFCSNYQWLMTGKISPFKSPKVGGLKIFTNEIKGGILQDKQKQEIQYSTDGEYQAECDRARRELEEYYATMEKPVKVAEGKQEQPKQEAPSTYVKDFIAKVEAEPQELKRLYMIADRWKSGSGSRPQQTRQITDFESFEYDYHNNSIFKKLVDVTIMGWYGKTFQKEAATA